VNENKVCKRKEEEKQWRMEGEGKMRFCDERQEN
jgi:hypothetical protein